MKTVALVFVLMYAVFDMPIVGVTAVILWRKSCKRKAL